MVRLFQVAERMRKFGIRLDSARTEAHRREAVARGAAFTRLFLKLTGVSRETLGMSGAGQTDAVRDWFKRAGAPDVIFSKVTKKAQFNAPALTMWAKDYSGAPFSQPAAALLGLRKAKTCVQFATAYLEVAARHQGRIHFGFYPLGTKTGRWSASATFAWTDSSGDLISYGLNAQNVPSKSVSFDFGDEGMLPLMVSLRDCFIPDTGCVWGKCLVPGTRILTADLKWVDVERLQEGEHLLGFSEDLRDPKKLLCPSTVEKIARLKKPCVRITTDRGVLVCSEDHLWVRTADKRYDRHNKCRHWVAAKELKEGDQLAYFVRPWTQPQDYDAGWLAGFMDGEGSVGKTGRVSFGQNPGATLDYARLLLDRYGFMWSKPVLKTRRCEITDIVGEPFSGLRFLGSIRPKRLLENMNRTWIGKRSWGKLSKPAQVISVQPAGVREVVAVQTSSKTFFAEGFFSHNCDFEALEARLIAYVTGAKRLMRWIETGADIHMENAKGLFTEARIPRDATKGSDDGKWKPFREAAKPCVYALTYQAPSDRGNDKYPDLFKTLKQVFPDLQDAYFKEICARFFKLHPEIRGWQRSVGAALERDGSMLVPQSGLRLFYPNTMRGRNQAQNLAFQGGGAALINRAIVQIDDDMVNFPGKSALLAQVHDELSFQIDERHVDEFSSMVEAYMGAPMQFGSVVGQVPAAMDVGPNWGACAARKPFVE